MTYLDVDEWGIVKLSQLERAIRRDTVLISVMAANNEIGTIQPLGKIGQIAGKTRHFISHGRRAGLRTDSPPGEKHWGSAC